MEHFDLKYEASLFDRIKEYIVDPLRMHGSSWIGISFNDKLIEIIYLNYLIRQYYMGIRLKT